MTSDFPRGPHPFRGGPLDGQMRESTQPLLLVLAKNVLHRYEAVRQAGLPGTDPSLGSWRFEYRGRERPDGIPDDARTFINPLGEMVYVWLGVPRGRTDEVLIVAQGESSELKTLVASLSASGLTVFDSNVVDGIDQDCCGNMELRDERIGGQQQT